MRKLINFNKKEVEEAIKTITLPGKSENLIDSGAVKNLMIFGDEVDIDIRIQNPSLQARKKLELEIIKAIHEKVYSKAKIKVKTKVDLPQNHQTISKGKPIPGVDSIIAISSGKEVLGNLL